ncbi:unnamed protein product [Nesidiocoris tenuis]|uniref:Uncharacterized protein n=1 Tax=Nesidiocoris tenuis TaxID=355587 RepID=A0A6H5HFA6_9HEMI|nr:unnamed protein product [Nesidiocoris tenuis]CAB0012325.1 unnamed protein product [Nesidiocoris tenuis]
MEVLLLEVDVEILGPLVHSPCPPQGPGETRGSLERHGPLVKEILARPRLSGQVDR